MIIVKKIVPFKLQNIIEHFDEIGKFYNNFKDINWKPNMAL